MSIELETYKGFNWRPTEPNESCIIWVDGSFDEETGISKPYEDFMCLYPWAKSFYMEWEMTWRPYHLYYMMKRNWWFPIIAISIYAAGIVYGQKFFKDRKPWNFRNILIMWNLGLSLFSIFGFFRVLPVVMHVVSSYTWRENLCYDPHLHTGHNEAGLWIFLFSISKFFELFDTFFIVVHKKPLILLHWYHHISVLLYCWYYLLYTAPAGIYFCLLNYGVHSIMYFYYFLMAAKIRPKWINPKLITVTQIVQMIGGVIITVMGIAAQNVKNCHTKPFNIAPTFVMYFSYLMLFTKFFVQRYYSKDKGKMKIF